MQYFSHLMVTVKYNLRYYGKFRKNQRLYVNLKPRAPFFYWRQIFVGISSWEPFLFYFFRVKNTWRDDNNKCRRFTKVNWASRNILCWNIEMALICNVHYEKNSLANSHICWPLRSSYAFPPKKALTSHISRKRGKSENPWYLIVYQKVWSVTVTFEAIDDELK